MTTTLSMDQITPEFIIEAAREAGLPLLPGHFFVHDEDNRVVGCCAEAALAIGINPNAFGSVATVRATNGGFLSSTFRCGLRCGFDGAEGHLNDEDYVKGYALGRATRLAAGLDAGRGEVKP